MKNNNRIIKIVFICVFISILALPTFAWLLLKVVSPKTVEKLNFDTGENRTLATFPKSVNLKTYTSEIEDWFDDNSPFRSVLYDLENDIDGKYENIYNNHIKSIFEHLLYPITSETVLDNYNLGYKGGYENGYNLGYEKGKVDSEGGHSTEELDAKYQEGYLKGIEDANTSSYDEAYNDGYNQGKEDGYSLGYTHGDVIGSNSGYSKGYNEGLSQGSEEGYTKGYNKGITLGNEEGYAEGYAVAYAKAYEEGYEKAYLEAYQKGYDDASSSSGTEYCDHTYDDGVIIMEATCKNFGVKKHVCTKCSKVYFEKIDKLEHVTYSTITESTCSTHGEEIIKCYNCDYEEHIELPLKAHNTYEEITESTCSTHGEKVIKCYDCDYEEHIELELKEHDLYQTTIDATCTKNGEIVTKCHNCNYETHQMLVSPGHSYEVTEHVDATCVLDGYTLYTCTTCGHTYTVTHEHSHDYKYVETISADYTTYGYDLYKCTKCEGVLRKNIVDKPLDTSYASIKYSGNTIIGRQDWLFLAENDSLAYYQGGNDWNETGLSDLAYWLGACNDLCKKKGIELYFVVAPNKEEVYSEYYPSVTINDSVKRVDKMVSYLQTNTSAKITYFKEALIKNKSKLDLFLHHDSHWNNAGSYIAVTELYKLMGLNTIDTEDLIVKPYTDMDLGDLITLGGLSNNPTYLNGDKNYEITYPGLNKFYKNINLKSNMVLIGDSFRLAMEQYLSKDFNLTSFHRDNFNEFTTQITNADYIVVEVVERLDWEMGTLFINLYNLLSK